MMCFSVKDRKRAKTNHCVIVLLDDTQLVHELHPSTTGQDLLDVVIKHLNLLETSYFGLKYLQEGGNRLARNHNWLDVDKSAIKQLRHVQPMTVYFGVKFYASDPCKLAEEITRYQFFLQCKQDILHARLPVSFELAVELFGYAIQSELGDFDPQRHQPGYTSEFQIVAQQTAELEQRAALFHRQLVGQVPATAELNFLERVKWLDLYGCALHPIQYDDEDGNGASRSQDSYALGLNPLGLLVLRNKLKVAQYMWPRLIKAKCQGRCLLVDVIDTQFESASATVYSAASQRPTNRRQRFGFRLADKEAAQQLRWALEEHKGFYMLLSSTVSQLAKRQAPADEPLLKLGQRFRNSIRSAISIGGGTAGHHQPLVGVARRPPSVKSQRGASERPPPTVVRMPSRRYSNRSLTRPAANLASQQQQLLYEANGLGPRELPYALGGGAATMVESQRQQALLMMSHFNEAQQRQAHTHMASKSQTLRPMSKEQSKRSNPYYQQMMAMMVAAQQQQQQQQQPQVTILAPGQHIVQPVVYKAASVVDGINRVGRSSQHFDQQQAATMRRNVQHQQQQQTILQQLFNTPARPGAQHSRAGNGHESPRSTKSAIAPSSAMKLAAKKLAKQQRQLIGGDAHLDQAQQHYAATTADYYGQPAVPNGLLMPTRRSKSTSENLHLMHQHQVQQGKMLLLATAAPMPPPPDYNTAAPHAQRQLHLQPDKLADERRASNKLAKQQQVISRSHRFQEDEDDYYCSRSDCSSIEERQRRQQRRNRFSGAANQPTEMDDNQQLVETLRRRSDASLEQFAANNVAQKDWNAIRRRHNEFSCGKGPLSQLDSQKVVAAQTHRTTGVPQKDANNNNNGGQQQNIVKNITNKQATPILLSMSSDFERQIGGGNGGGNIGNSSAANSKAVQLLNLQRQQLNSQSSYENNVATKTTFTSSSVGSTTTSGGDSVSSSLASSPKAAQQQHLAGGAGLHSNHLSGAVDSTGSSSTTSGYYAGSNSTGPASVDSDTLAEATASGHKTSGDQKQTVGGDSSRAKMALGAYGLKQAASDSTRPPASAMGVHKSEGKQRQFYLGDTSEKQKLDERARQVLKRNPSSKSIGQVAQQQWSPLDQLQQHAPSSLKYVSFDV